MDFPEVFKEVSQLEEKMKTLRQKIHKLNKRKQNTSMYRQQLRGMDIRLDQLKTFSSNIILYYNTHEFLRKLRAALLQSLLIKDMMYVLKSYARYVSLPKTTIKKKEIKNTRDFWEGTQYIQHLDQKKITIDKSFCARWEGRDVYSIGENTYFNIEKTWRKDNLFISEGLAENTALVLHGINKKSEKKALFFVSSMAGNERRDFNMLLGRAEEKGLGDIKIFISGYNKNISKDFIDAVCSRVSGAEIMFRTKDASIAFDEKEIIIVNSPSFKKHFIAKKERKIRINWNDVKSVPEGKYPFWLDTLSYEEASDELNNADKSNHEFWNGFVIRMELEFNKQAEEAAPKSP